MARKTLIIALVALAPFMLRVGESRAYNYNWIQHEGHLYALTEYVLYKTWYQAEAEAVNQGGHLVTVNSATEENWLKTTFGSNTNVYRL